MQRRQATGASVDCREKKDEWGTAATSAAGTGRAESERGGSPWFKETVEEQRRARPHCYGIVSDSTAAECERDPWAAEGKVEERVTSEGPRTRDGQWDKGAEWAAREDEKWKSAEESQPDYDKALSSTLGGDRPANSTDGDYMSALSNLEKKEEERKAREEAERRRLEEERRSREVAERRRIEAERRARRSSQGWRGNHGGSGRSGSSGSKRRGSSYPPVPCCEGYGCCCDGGWGCGQR